MKTGFFQSISGNNSSSRLIAFIVVMISLAFTGFVLWSGYSVSFVKDNTTLTNGQTGIYVGNDGKNYATICIGTQEWTVTPIKETKFRNGTVVQEYSGSNSGWSALRISARCYYIP